MSLNSFEPGQEKTSGRDFACRRLGPPRHARIIAPPAVEQGHTGIPPQQPLPTRRAGVAFLFKLIPWALLGDDPWGRAARDTIERRAADIRTGDILLIALVFWCLLAAGAIAGIGS